MTKDSERRESRLEPFLITAVVCIISVALAVSTPPLAVRAFAAVAGVAALFLPLVYAVTRDGHISIPRWAYRGPYQ